jgi:hypothetical protein
MFCLYCKAGREVNGLRACSHANIQTGVTSLTIRLSDIESKPDTLAIRQTAATCGAI